MKRIMILNMIVLSWMLPCLGQAASEMVVDENVLLADSNVLAASYAEHNRKILSSQEFQNLLDTPYEYFLDRLPELRKDWDKHRKVIWAQVRLFLPLLQSFETARNSTDAMRFYEAAAKVSIFSCAYYRHQKQLLEKLLLEVREPGGGLERQQKMLEICLKSRPPLTREFFASEIIGAEGKKDIGYDIDLENHFMLIAAQALMLRNSHISDGKGGETSDYRNFFRDKINKLATDLGIVTEKIEIEKSFRGEITFIWKFKNPDGEFRVENGVATFAWRP